MFPGMPNDLRRSQLSGSAFSQGPLKPYPLPQRPLKRNFLPCGPATPSAPVAQAGGSNGSLFTPEFSKALQNALDRNGSGVLFSGPPEEPRKKVEVEFMEIAVQHSLERLRALARLKNETEVAIAKEIKQVERLKFVLQKTTSNAAYTTALQKLLDEREASHNVDESDSSYDSDDWGDDVGVRRRVVAVAGLSDGSETTLAAHVEGGLDVEEGRGAGVVEGGWVGPCESAGGVSGGPSDGGNFYSDGEPFKNEFFQGAR